MHLRSKALTASLLLPLLYSAAEAQTFVVQGSTTFTHRIMEPYQAAIEASSGCKLIVVPNKSSLGLLALLDKHADFAMISGPLEKEVTALKATNPAVSLDTLHTFNIFRTRMAFAVNYDNPLRHVTSSEMRGILLGEIANWRDIGGQNMPIRLVHVRDGGGVEASVEDALLNGKHIDVQNPILVQISTQVVKIVEQLPEALGLAQLSIVANSKTNELKIDRPIEQQLDLVTLGDPTPEMQKVINAARLIASTAVDKL